MPLFALINQDLTDTRERKVYLNVPPLGDLGGSAKPYWVPVVEEVDDTSTRPDDLLTSPWVETVEPLRLLRSRTIRDKTPTELESEDTARVDALLLNSGVMRAFGLMLFEVAKAGRTDDWTFFTGVTNAATFKALLKSLIR